MEPWRVINKDNVMLGFVLEKGEKLTEELLEEFKEIFREKFGFEPEKVEIGRPIRHIFVGNWPGEDDGHK